MSDALLIITSASEQCVHENFASSDIPNLLCRAGCVALCYDDFSEKSKFSNVEYIDG